MGVEKYAQEKGVYIFSISISPKLNVITHLLFVRFETTIHLFVLQ